MEAACGRHHGNGATDIERNLIMATLTTGPLGIGDMIGGTNLTLLNRALRSDGVILKPGFAAHRLDSFYLNASTSACACDERPARVVPMTRNSRRAGTAVKSAAAHADHSIS